MNLVLLIVAIGLSALFVILLIFSIFYSAYLQRQRDRSEEEGPVDLTNENGEIDPIKQIKHLKKTTAEFGIKYEELKFGKLLGKGSQGEVFKAHWRGSTVAVKKVDTRKVPPEIIEEFAQEAQIMRRLRHPCLTLFMGVSLEHPHLCILTELVARGSLFDIIHDVRRTHTITAVAIECVSRIHVGPFLTFASFDSFFVCSHLSGTRRLDLEPLYRYCN